MPPYKAKIDGIRFYIRMTHTDRHTILDTHGMLFTASYNVYPNKLIYISTNNHTILTNQLISSTIQLLLCWLMFLPDHGTTLELGCNLSY